MPIQFIDASKRQVQSVIVVIYGPPGVGKTSLALTADTPVLLDFNRGVHRAGNRLDKATTPPIHQWSDIAGLNASDLAPYKTIVIDTVGDCLEILGENLLATNPDTYGRGSLTQNGYGELKSRFSRFFSMLRNTGKDIVVVAHSEEQQRGDTTVSRLIAMGGSKNTIHQNADLIGHVTRSDSGLCHLTFDPSSTTYGKNCHLPDFDLNDPASGRDTDALAGIIAQTKTNINSEIERASEVEAALNALKTELEALPKTPEAYTARIRELHSQGAPMTHGQILLDMGRANGWKYDRDTKAFVAPQPPKDVVVQPATPETDVESARIMAEDARTAQETPSEGDTTPEAEESPSTPVETPIGKCHFCERTEPLEEDDGKMRCVDRDGCFEAYKAANSGVPAQTPPPPPEPEAEACSYCGRVDQDLIESREGKGMKQCADYESCVKESKKQG